jgi:hypothetical protein
LSRPSGLIAHGVEKFFAARPHLRYKRRDPIVADIIHEDKPSTTSTVEMFAKPVVGQLGLRVGIRADQPVKNLPQRERQMLGVLSQHEIDLSEQFLRRAPWRPWHKPAYPRPPALRATQQASDGVHYCAARFAPLTTVG